MKKVFTFLAMLASSATFAQITINSADVPTPTGKIPLQVFLPTSSPALGANQAWNYGNYATVSVDTMPYVIETNPLFTAAGVDVSLDLFKSFNGTFGYYGNREIDYSSTSVAEKGLTVTQAAYGLGNLTGNNADSLKIPQQAFLLSTPTITMQFPMTMSSAWKTVSPRTVNFTLTVAAAGLNNTPSQHRYRIVRNDSIVAWGKLRVYTGSGVSIPYDVLVDKFEQYAIDSFYIGGMPAPATLQGAFNVSQGQMTDMQYAYHFYRKGSPMYMMRLTYGTDNTYTTIAGAYMNGNGLTNSVGIKEAGGINYTSVVFPNPTNGSEISIQLVGKTIANASYLVTDLTGKTVAQGTPSAAGNNHFKISFSDEMSNGFYFITLLDETGTAVVNEKIQVQK